MAFHTTSINLTTSPTLLFSGATTWGNSAGASNYDTVPLSIFNASTIQIRIVGTSAAAAVATGYPIPASASMTADMLRSDAVWAATTASTGTVLVIAGRQIGGV